MKKKYIKIAGVINLLTAFIHLFTYSLIHLFAGQMDLVRPLINSHLTIQQKGEWIAAWHLITILLFFTSFLIIRAGFRNVEQQKIQALKLISSFYILGMTTK